MRRIIHWIQKTANLIFYVRMIKVKLLMKLKTQKLMVLIEDLVDLNIQLYQSDYAYWNTLESSIHSFKIDNFNYLKCSDCDHNYDKYKMLKIAYYEMYTKFKKANFIDHYLQTDLINRYNVTNCIFSVPEIGELGEDYDRFDIKLSDPELFKKILLVFTE